MAELLNELIAAPDEIVVVLDDYQVIDAPQVHEGMAYLLDHLPDNVHVVVATRADPPFPLARLRVRGELIEIRASDLRFSLDEATAYFTDTMGLAISTADVATLERRTEGWIAALQLAGLSMQGREDLAAFIADFAGDDRYIVDYLAEEVLQRQPAEIRTFLLKTSILSRLSGALCDAVTGQDGSRARLESLDRANLFLVPLDDRRQWYRYHHLFADVLQMRLLDEHPGELEDLHRRAGAWYEQHGEMSEAIRHAIAGGDIEHAADLIELAIPDLRKWRQETTLRRWVEALPASTLQRRPVLSVNYAGALLSTGATDEVDELLMSGERLLDALANAVELPSPTGIVVANEVELRHLPAAIAMFRAALGRVTGDVAATITNAQRALDLVDADDHVGRGGAAALLGLAHWTTGDLGSGYRWFAQGLTELERAGYLTDVVGGAINLADMRVAEGRLDDAVRTYEHGLRIASSQSGPVLRGAADMHVGLSDLARERDDLARAAQHLLTARGLGEESGFPRYPCRWRVAAAGLREAEGDLDGALELLDEAQRVFFADMSPDTRPIAALRARWCVAHGRLSDARAWAQAQQITAMDELSYAREYEHSTLARLLLAQGIREPARGSVDSAIDVAERLLAVAEAGNRPGSVIDNLIVLALARQAHGDAPASVAALERALALAAPEGYVRSFVDEGAPMAKLLTSAAARKGGHPYGRVLLAAATRVGAQPGSRQALVEPLTERELEVLRLLRTDLDGPDIARELSVSLNTLRTHTKNVYAKLGVNSRREAVRHAVELDLFSGAPPQASI